MHSACMATKTISLRLDAYEKLKGARQHPGESFSQVVLRGRWRNATVTAGEWLGRLRQDGAHFSEEALRDIERLKETDEPPEDKWRS